MDHAELARLWERHTELEFDTKDAAATVATMTPDNYVNHVPVMTGGRGTAEMIEFYGTHFIPKMPADTTLRLLSRTIGDDRVIDEFVFSFTHDVAMDWMLPGIVPTGRTVEIPMVVAVQFEGDKIACERIYWDQASVLVQLGLLDPGRLPVTGVEQARKFENSELPPNELMGAAWRG
ncbi:ester cyclase [Mycolicibacterium sp. CR10]|uniref:ester cyclase n=1 Tax=Mycolicibacterium sp. CR10 TaxID=2562314 RepID=UPI0010BFDE04|nr:nuclear transport factor 2 family protein [Mycolicibacterium sp. CR10]